MVAKKVNLLALTLLNVLIVSTVTSSTAAPAASSSNIGYNIQSDRISPGEMAIPVAVAYDQDPQQQETLRAEDEYINYLRELLRRRAALNALTIQAMEPIVRKRGQVCLPGTDCDFINWADEADAKDVLYPGSEMNPGR